MKQYNTFLFDADGTLLDTVDLIVKCFEYTLSHYNVKIPERSEIVSHIGIPFRNQISIYFGEIDEDSADEIWDFYREYQLQHYMDYIKLFPGTLDTLNRLKERGAKTAIVTSRKHNTLDLFLKQLSIFDIFDTIITPDCVSKPKPDAEPTLKAIKDLDSLPEESLFIGDAVYDRISAGKAGVDFALVSWTHIPLSDFKPAPEIILNSMNDILSFSGNKDEVLK